MRRNAPHRGELARTVAQVIGDLTHAGGVFETADVKSRRRNGHLAVTSTRPGLGHPCRRLLLEQCDSLLVCGEKKQMNWYGVSPRASHVGALYRWRSP